MLHMLHMLCMLYIVYVLYMLYIVNMLYMQYIVYMLYTLAVYRVYAVYAVNLVIWRVIWGDIWDHLWTPVAQGALRGKGPFECSKVLCFTSKSGPTDHFISTKCMVRCTSRGGSSTHERRDPLCALCVSLFNLY